MNVIAFDVGVSTGIALGELAPRTFPRLIAATTIVCDFSKMADAFKEADAFISGHQIDMVIMEMPFATRLNDQAKKMELLRNRWLSWAESTFRNNGIPIKQISPSDWKPMPSGKIDVFARQEDHVWVMRGVGATKHERDAACMLHWVATWQLGKA